jgi:pSer/pThr/pTyr-binding forkhead associated (FHA) protein
MEAVLTGPMGRTLLGSSEVTIGCDADNSLIVADLRTAAHHALLRPDGLGYAIIDLGSEYGTIVNGRWLEPNKTRPLLPGDVIQIGNTSLTFEVFQNPAAIPTGLLGVGVGSPLGTGEMGRENAPIPAPPRTDIADQDTGRFNPVDAAKPAASPKISISSLRSRLNQSQPMLAPYTSQPWVPGGITTYPPQQQLWQQDRRRLYIVLAAMLAIIIVFSLISLIASRSTPDKTLDTFCNALLAGNGQLAANQLSPKLQNQQGSFLIASVVANKITTCVHTPSIVKGASATATLSLTIPSNSGAANSLSKTLVTLIQEANGFWKIDALQGQ